MSTTSSELSALFTRDLARLVRQLEALDDRRLWQALPGVTNSAGNLMLHLSGNLREFIGRQLGGVPYVRNRAHEFGAKDVSRSAVMAELTELAVLIPGVLARMPDGRWNDHFPENVLGEPLTNRQFVIHLYGHLNYHLGQIDYLRRALTGDGALTKPTTSRRPRAGGITLAGSALSCPPPSLPATAASNRPSRAVHVVRAVGLPPRRYVRKGDRYVR